MDRGVSEHLHQAQASTLHAHGHRPLERRILAPKQWSPVFAGWGGQEDGHAPLRRASGPQERVPMSGLSGPLHAAVPRLGATPMAIQLCWGAWICSGGWWSGGFPASSGGSRSCNSGSKTTPWARIGIANVPVLTAGECCILAALEVVGGDDKARSVSFLTSCLSYAYLTCLPT